LLFKKGVIMRLMIIGLTSFLLLSLFGCGPKPIGTVSFEKIDIRSEPEQERILDAPPIEIQAQGYDIKIIPKAKYDLQGIVLGRKNYNAGWNSIISPCDLAIAWDKMVITGMYKQIEWSQSSRWYYWRYDEEFPFDNAFIARYSANTHIIPANTNIKSAVLNIARGDTVELIGYLAFVTADKKENNFWWNSSLSRNDTGDGSCEIMYVTGIRHGGMFYK